MTDNSDINKKNSAEPFEPNSPAVVKYNETRDLEGYDYEEPTEAARMVEERISDKYKMKESSSREG